MLRVRAVLLRLCGDRGGFAAGLAARPTRGASAAARRSTKPRRSISEVGPELQCRAHCCLKRNIERIGGRIGSWSSEIAKLKLENLQLYCKLWMENTELYLVDLVSTKWYWIMDQSEVKDLVMALENLGEDMGIGCAQIQAVKM